MGKCSIFSYSIIFGLYINEAFCLSCAKTSKSVHLAGASRYGEAQRPEPFYVGYILTPTETERYLPRRINLRTSGGLCISSAGPILRSVGKPSLLSAAPQQSPAVAVSFNCGSIFKCPFWNLILISHFTLENFYHLRMNSEVPDKSVVN